MGGPDAALGEAGARAAAARPDGAGGGKAPGAFRTISEVSGQLGVAPHVLRFWEKKFPQVRPMQRAGGRRYYRASDVALLAGIRWLLHEEGMTIKGVQRRLRDGGPAAVAAPVAAARPAAGPVAGPAAPRGRPGAEGPGAEADDDALGDGAGGDAPAAAEAGAPDAALGLRRPLRVDPALARSNAARLGPLVARLEALRARLDG